MSGSEQMPEQHALGALVQSAPMPRHVAPLDVVSLDVTAALLVSDDVLLVASADRLEPPVATVLDEQATRKSVAPMAIRISESCARARGERNDC